MSNRRLNQCESNIYHISTRGIGRQIIFEDNVDRRWFGEKMLSSFGEKHIVILAWCFMDNHVHILVKGPLEDISSAMQSLASSYARHFNKRHDRVGHLFQERFFSVPVKDENQLIATIRYIHRNPDDIEEGLYTHYAWSSYREYLGEKSALGFAADSKLVSAILGSLDSFIRAHEEFNGSIESATDSDLNQMKEQFIDSVLKGSNVFAIKSLPKKQRDETIRALHDAGLSIRSIERLTSIGRSIIARVISCHV